MDEADADHRRVERGDVAADDALQAEHEMRLGIGDVGGKMRLRAAMAAHTAEGDLPAIGRRQERADIDAKTRGRHAGHVVQAVDRIAGEALEQFVGEHGVGAAAAFLGRLEDQVDGAGEVAVLGEIAPGREQHRGMPVMTAGMHPARILRGIGQVRRLIERQAIHIGAQAHGPARPVAADHADHAGLADILGDLDTPLTQLVGDELGRTDLFEAEFGMLMDVAADRGEGGVMLVEPGVELRHGR